MKFIKQESIDEVLSDAQVLDAVISTEGSAAVKPKGVYYFCCSPFTKETTPSFCIKKVENIFFDYSSGFGGNAVSFLMKRLNISFFEAVTKAAEASNIVLKYEDQSEDQKRIYDEILAMKGLVETAADRYQAKLQSLEPGHWAKQMISERQFTEDILHLFKVGFAPNERSFISTPAINNGNFEIATSLGLTTTKDGSSWDFFRDRLMFPIQDRSGVIVGFGGRRNNDEENEKYAKYLNSKESKVYLKERLLYGLFQAKKNIAEKKSAVLLEGYTDVIALHQGGLTNSVATSGTALSSYHVKEIVKLCPHVILFRDGDKAGMRAVMRDIDICLEYNLKVSLVICPDGEDPDSLSRQCNISDFVYNNLEDAIKWKAKTLAEDARNSEIEELGKTLKSEYDLEVKKLTEEMLPPEAMDKLNPMDKKFAKKENDRLFKQIGELEKEMKSALADLPKYEPEKISQAVESMAETLFKIGSTVKRQEYLKIVSKQLDVKMPIIQQIISQKEVKAEADKKKRSLESDKKEVQILGLPEGADKDQYLEDRFCVIGNAYYFHNGTGFFKGTNHRIEPLFHIEGKSDNKRLCEIINEKGHKRLIDFDSTDFINFTKIKERLIQEGFFFWEPGSTPSHFQLVAKRLLNHFITATELKILGLQREGFFAFANGVEHDRQFHKVNKYGIVNIEGLEKKESEYRSDITHFYSPSHSEIYNSVREDDDPYENDRHFVYMPAPVSLDQWMNQMVKVFGDKGKMGIAFTLAMNFRDLFLSNFDYFPLMGGFGQKDSGKSGFGNCLQGFFYYDLKALELNTSTLVGLARRLTRCRNTTVFCDEYRDDIEESLHQTLKGTWNGIGREKGKGFETNRTTVDKINSGVYFAGQYLPTRDDGALTSRTIPLIFGNKDHTADEKEEYGKLIQWNKSGLSSFVLDVIRHRKDVQKNLVTTYSEVARELKAALKDSEFQNRVYENYLVLLVTVKLLEEKFSFPFTYKDFFNQIKEGIVETSDMIADSDGLAAFWQIISYLAGPDPKSRAIYQGADYMIETPRTFVYVPKKGEKETYNNSKGDKILFLNFQKVHQDYHKEVSKRQGEEVIGATTIRNYLKTRKYFIGLFAAKRMGDRTPSGYAFNYTMMKNMGILDLDDLSASQTSMDLPGPETNVELPDGYNN